MERLAVYLVHDPMDSQPHHQIAPRSEADERITYDFRSARKQAKEETIRYFQQRSAELGVDWKEQYRQYKERMRKRHWKNPI